MIISRCARAGAVAVLLAGASVLPVLAQTTNPTPAQTIPGLDNFSLPSSRPTAQPTPVPQETPAPTPTAAPPIAAPTPTPRPRVTATPLPRPTSVPPQAPRAAATPRPTSTPTPTPTPAAIAPSPTPVAAAASPTPVATPTPTPSATATPPDSAERPSGGWGGWIGAAAGLAALIAGVVWWRRRREAGDRQVVEPVAEELQPVVVPRREPTLAAEPVMLELVPVVPSERAQVTMALYPRRAGLNLLSATVEAELLVRNEGTAPAAAIRVGATLMGAAAGPSGDVSAWFAQPIGRPVTPPFALAPGEERRVRLVVALPRAEISPLQAGGRAMFVPVVAVNLLYDASGMPGQTAQAVAVGVERVDSAKLAPLWLDQPARMFDAIGSRPYAVGVVR